MRPSAPLLRISPVATLAVLLPALGAFAAVEYRAKADETGLYRTVVMEPPPVGLLSEGDVVTLLVTEGNRCLVKTAGGLRGWVRNSDLVGVKIAEGGRHRIGEQVILGSDFNHSEIIIDDTDPVVEVGTLNRSFDGEVVEAMDREQLEMRNDEN